MSAWMGVAAIIVVIAAVVGAAIGLRRSKAKDAKHDRRPEDDIYPLF